MIADPYTYRCFGGGAVPGDATGRFLGSRAVVGSGPKVAEFWSASRFMRGWLIEVSTLRSPIRDVVRPISVDTEKHVGLMA
jgi:hypothetical protein